MEYYLKSEIARIANINPETLRFYEKIKLIPTPKRSENGYRQYSKDTLLRISLINKAKFAGFTLNQIKELFSLIENETDKATDLSVITHAIEKRINELDSQLKELKKLKKQLVDFNNEMQSKVCPNIESFLANKKPE